MSGFVFNLLDLWILDLTKMHLKPRWFVTSDLQSRFGLSLKSSYAERWKVKGGHLSQAQFTQELADDWSKLEAMTWEEEVTTTGC